MRLALIIAAVLGCALIYSGEAAADASGSNKTHQPLCSGGTLCVTIHAYEECFLRHTANPCNVDSSNPDIKPDEECHLRHLRRQYGMCNAGRSAAECYHMILSGTAIKLLNADNSLGKAPGNPHFEACVRAIGEGESNCIFKVQQACEPCKAAGMYESCYGNIHHVCPSFHEEAKRLKEANEKAKQRCLLAAETNCLIHENNAYLECFHRTSEACHRPFVPDGQLTSEMPKVRHFECHLMDNPQASRLCYMEAKDRSFEAKYDCLRAIDAVNPSPIPLRLSGEQCFMKGYETCEKHRGSHTFEKCFCKISMRCLEENSIKRMCSNDAVCFYENYIIPKCDKLSSNKQGAIP